MEQKGPGKCWNGQEPDLCSSSHQPRLDGRRFLLALALFLMAVGSERHCHRHDIHEVPPSLLSQKDGHKFPCHPPHIPGKV